MLVPRLKSFGGPNGFGGPPSTSPGHKGGAWERARFPVEARGPSPGRAQWRFFKGAVKPPPVAPHRRFPGGAGKRGPGASMHRIRILTGKLLLRGAKNRAASFRERKVPAMGGSWAAKAEDRRLCRLHPEEPRRLGGAASTAGPPKARTAQGA